MLKNLFKYWTYQIFSPKTVLKEKYESFKTLLKCDKIAHEFMAVLEDIYYTPKKCDFQTVVKTYEHFSNAVFQMVEALLTMCPSRYWSLKAYFKKFDFYVRFMLAPPDFDFSPPFIIELDQVSQFDETISGKKAFSLSYLHCTLNLPVPDGFVITTNAFHYFLKINELFEPLNEILAHLDINNSASLEQAAFEIKQLILNATVPKDIEIAVTDAINALDGSTDINFRAALRSSAVKEDGKASFAGQYLTMLNVEKSSILEGYKCIIASKYSAQALFYRISHGILNDETPMAVLVLKMIDSHASGVMYTQDIEKPLSENVLIYSVWGQCGLLVDGEIAPDVIMVSKKEPDQIVRSKTGAKLKQMILGQNTKTKTIDTVQHQRDQISLDEPSALTLARWGISLENHFNHPQDIEWCQDKSDNLFILQSRPLNIHFQKTQKTTCNVHVPENTIICSGGETVCAGIGTGYVYMLEKLSQINNIPNQSVVVTRHAMPQFVTAINKIKAMIISTGSTASHFSSIAREFKIPAVVNIANGFNVLKHGSLVTVDADNCIVYEGTVKDLPQRSETKDDFFLESSFMIKLRYVINFCAKLKLTDPESRAFIPESCRSLHDIIRFTHETALKEMFLIGDRKGGRKKGAKKLISDIPMLFYILDVGAGTNENRKNEKNLKPEDITSIPMKSLLKGLLNPGICWSETSHFDWEEYDRIVMSGGIISADASMFGSYAVLSKDYLNVNFRFGYHFVILDTICTALKEDNYILFRFSGGGGTLSGRTLRASFIKGILTKIGFMVEIKSDLIDAEFKYGTLKTMQKTLDMIGRLLGATKLMDMYLKENLDINLAIDDFMNGRYDFRSVMNK